MLVLCGSTLTYCSLDLATAVWYSKSMRIIVIIVLKLTWWLSCEQFFVGYHWDIMKPSVQDNSYDGVVHMWNKFPQPTDCH